MWQSVQKNWDSRWALALFALLLLAGIWGLTLWQLDNDKRQTIAATERQSRDLVRLFSEHAARTLQAADQAALFLRQRYVAEGHHLNISDELESSLAAGKLYHLFSIIAPNGDVVLSSQPFSPTNLADRAHFRAHIPTGPDILYVSAPVKGRVSGRWSLQISRRISLTDGSFGGVVVVSLDPIYFTNLYSTVDVGRHGSVALIGDDGIVRARRVGDADSLGQDISRSQMFAAIHQGGASGSGLYNGPIDGRKRFYAYAPLPGLPLHALVGLDQKETMAPYVEHERMSLALAGLASAMLLAMTAGLSILMRQLIASREQACAANLAKSRFLSNMSHELRTPLNGVLGYAELLQAESGDGRQGSFAGRIHECGMRLLGLVEAVLELSSLESGESTLSLRQEQLGELAQRAMAGQRAAAEAKGLLLDLRFEPGLPRHYVCDRAKILRMLDLLLHNAVLATSTGGVQLQLQSTPGWLVFRVRDSGPGLPPEVRKRLFQQFTLADDSASRKRDGVGLGLAIAFRLAHLMGGNLVLESSSPDGTTFTISLPYLRLQQPAGAIVMSEEA